MDASGHLFVANFNNNSVTEYARGASETSPLSQHPRAATGVSVPGAVAVDAPGHVFVANFNNNSVSKYARGAR